MENNHHPKKKSSGTEYASKLLSDIGEVVDDGVQCTSFVSVYKCLISIGELLGMNMSEAKENLDDMRSNRELDEEEDEEAELY